MRLLNSTPLIILLGLLMTTESVADYEDGVEAAFSGDFDTAYREFTLAAEAGLELAQYNLGILYFTGQGVDRDYDLAFKWTAAAAQQGHIAAQYNLGSLYFEGQGIRRDRDQAIDWYGQAARNGHAAAAFTLASMYQRGRDVDKDKVLAHAYASLAIASDYAEAAEIRTELEADMSDSELRAARRLYAQWQIQ